MPPKGDGAAALVAVDDRVGDAPWPGMSNEKDGLFTLRPESSFFSSDFASNEACVGPFVKPSGLSKLNAGFGASAAADVDDGDPKENVGGDGSVCCPDFAKEEAKKLGTGPSFLSGTVVLEASAFLFSPPAGALKKLDEDAADVVEGFDEPASARGEETLGWKEKRGLLVGAADCEAPSDGMPNENGDECTSVLPAEDCVLACCGANPPIRLRREDSPALPLSPPSSPASSAGAGSAFCPCVAAEVDVPSRGFVGMDGDTLGKLAAEAFVPEAFEKVKFFGNKLAGNLILLSSSVLGESFIELSSSASSSIPIRPDRVCVRLVFSAPWRSDERLRVCWSVPLESLIFTLKLSFTGVEDGASPNSCRSARCLFAAEMPLTENPILARDIGFDVLTGVAGRLLSTFLGGEEGMGKTLPDRKVRDVSTSALLPCWTFSSLCLALDCVDKPSRLRGGSTTASSPCSLDISSSSAMCDSPFSSSSSSSSSASSSSAAARRLDPSDISSSSRRRDELALGVAGCVRRSLDRRPGSGSTLCDSLLLRIAR